MLAKQPASVQQESSPNSFEEDFAKQARWLRRGRRGRRRHINCRVRLRLVGRGRRRIHDRSVTFFLFRRRIYCLGFLFASREQRRSTNQNANMFFHKVVDGDPLWVI